jgi:large subunit ribosomal protein L1
LPELPAVWELPSQAKSLINQLINQIKQSLQMATLTKKRKAVIGKYDAKKAYSVADASKIVKDITTVKFDASVDLAIRLGVDPRKANQMVRGTVTLPHGTGKTMRVLALVTPDKEAEAKAAGADFVGLDEYIEKIKGGWTDVDVIITMPSVMGKVGALGRVLGPRGLMPNPKTGTVTMDIGKAVTDSKGGKIDFKVDKAGIVHAAIGKVSFDASKLAENAGELMQTIMKLKPSSAKGTYVRSVTMSSTMSPGVAIDTKLFN